MEIRYGALVIDVPADWSDQSSLLFVAPASANDLPSTVKVEEPVETLSLRIVPHDDQTAQQMLDREEEKLLAVAAKPEVVEDAPFTCPLGNGWQRVHKVKIAGAPLRQICVVVVVGRLAVLATATSGEARFARVRPQLEHALASLKRASA